MLHLLINMNNNKYNDVRIWLSGQKKIFSQRWKRWLKDDLKYVKRPKYNNTQNKK